MKFKNVYFINGTAYAGKSTLVKNLANEFGGIVCEENYHDGLSDEISREEFPYLHYTKDLRDWHDFVTRTPDEYEEWIDGVTRECEILELRILEKLCREDKPIFVDTNICIDTLRKISDKNHVIIMLADPEISVKRFFERPDREKQFLYRLLLDEDDPTAALENFRNCLSRINSEERYNAFKNSGFNVIFRDENRSEEQTLELASKMMKLI